MEQGQPESSTLVNNTDHFRIPEYQRNIFPTNIYMSAKDICVFSSIIKEANEASLKIELEAIKDGDENKEQKTGQIKDLMRVEYNLRAPNGDNINGLNIPNESDFPDRLVSFFISNEQIARRAINQSPQNHVNAFFGFSAPPLKIDVMNFPSNPTPNNSVINVVGRNEDWVRATADKIQEFLGTKKTIRPVIHGSGAYDLFLFGLYLPINLGLLERYDAHIFPWLEQKSILFNVVFGIYLFFLFLIAARLLFQIIRWLFPPVEYYKQSRTKAMIVRGLIGTALFILFSSALNSFGKYLFHLFFS